MKTLQINEANAIKAYENGSKETKELLTALLGEEPFKKPVIKNIMDRVKTFDDALTICPPSENLMILLEYNGTEVDMLASVAHAKLSIIAKALNEGWKPDWKNGDQYKYTPFFIANTDNSGFSYYHYYYWSSCTSVGSRLCYKSSEIAEYAGKQFSSLYNDLFRL